MLTEQQIRDMEPGRELNRLVRMNIFGDIDENWSWIDTWGHNWIKNTGGHGSWFELPFYSTDISAAMEVEATFNQDEQTRSAYMIQLYILVGLQPHIPPTLEDLYIIAHASAADRCKAALIAHMRGGSGE